LLLAECLADCFGQSLAKIISLLRTEVNAENTKKKGEAQFLPTLNGLGFLAQFFMNCSILESSAFYGGLRLARPSMLAYFVSRAGFSFSEKTT